MAEAMSPPTTGFGSYDGLDAEMAYMQSFGQTANKTVIYDPWIPNRPPAFAKKEEDPYHALEKEMGYKIGQPYNRFADLGKWQESMLSKAFTWGGSANTLLPIYVDPDIIRVTQERTPFLALTRRVTNRGRTADWNQLTALSNAQWKPEDAELADVNDTYVRQTKPIKFGYSVGRLTGPAAAAMREYQDAANLEVINKTASLRLLEQQYLIQGEAAATPSDSDLYVADLDGYDGLMKQITTNTVNASAAKISSDMLRSGIRIARTAGGNPNLILMHSIELQALKEGLTTSVIFNTNRIGTLEFGIQSMIFDGIPILEMPLHMPTTVDKRIVLILDMSTIEMRVLLDTSMQELARVNDSDKFMVKVYETGICKAEAFCSKIYGIGVT